MSTALTPKLLKAPARRSPPIRFIWGMRKVLSSSLKAPTFSDRERKVCWVSASMVASVGYFQIDKGIASVLLHGVLDHVPKGFEPRHHPGHRAVLVEFENQIRLFLHDELVKVFNKGIGAAAEI